MLIKNSKVYDILKYIQRIALPAVLTFTVTIGKIAGWNTENISLVGSGIIALFGAFLQAEYFIWNGSEDPEKVANEKGETDA